MIRSSTGRANLRGLRRRPTSVGLRLEPLESRRLLAIITVNSTSDRAFPVNGDGNLTLRDAILLNNGTITVSQLSPTEQALVTGGTPNTAGIRDTIQFIIGSGAQSITLNSALPQITHLATITGKTQPTYSTTPLIEINGNGRTGLTTDSSNSLNLLGVVLNRFSGPALTLNASGNTVQNNYVGTNAAGTAASANTGAGILLVGSSNNTIGNSAGGPTSSGAGNVIAGNGGDGITLAFGSGGSSTNRIAGNTIGLSATGLVAIGNGGNGISIDGGSTNTIGGNNVNARNFIGANGGWGIVIGSTSGTSTGNAIANNLIGVASDGTTAAGNTSGGISVSGAAGTTIGGLGATSGNVISGSTGTLAPGIFVTGTITTATTIVGNRIGTNSNGTAALPNTGHGIRVISDNLTTIGGSSPNSKNVISGNAATGIDIGGTSTGLTIQGNYIGTDTNGSVAIPNGADGVWIESTASNITVGGISVYGTLPGGARNLISGNTGNGIAIDSTTGSNTVQGNYIGLDVNGTTTIGNGRFGIALSSPSNTIGGAAAGAGNVISGQNGVGYSGIDVRGNVSTLNTIQGNRIGTDANGLIASPNWTGITISGRTNTVANNLISGNLSDGINIAPPLGNATGNLIQANQIGTDSTGTANLGNGGWGVNIVPQGGLGTGNQIGGTSAALGNTIAYNVSGGVAVGTANTNTTILSNSIYSNNGRLGIDVAPLNVATAPVATITQAIVGSGSTLIRGTYQGAANTAYRFQFFNNPNNGVGQGQNYITNLAGDFTLTSNGAGLVDFSSAGSQLSISYPPTVPAGGYITATVTDPNGNTSEFSLPSQVTSVSTFTLGVTGTPNPTLLTNNTTYVVSITNNGPSPVPANTLAVTNVAPAGSAIQSVTMSNGGQEFSRIGQTSTIIFPNAIGVGVTATITVVVQTGQTGSNVDTASFSYQGTNYSANASVNVITSADLSITATATPPAPNNLGDTITYSAIIQNAGPSTAVGVQVVDTLPEAVAVGIGYPGTSVTFTQGGVTITPSFTITPDPQVPGSGQTITVNLGDLTSSAAPITMTVTGSIVDTGQGIANRFTVSSTGGTTDPNLGNNSVTITRNFTTAVDLQVVSITSSGPTTPTPPYDAAGPALINEDLTFTIVVKNNGPSPALSSTLNVALPTLFGYVFVPSLSGVNGTLGTNLVNQISGGVSAILGDLANGEISTITVVVIPTATGNFGVTATVASTTNELNPADNVASLATNVQPVSNLSAVVVAAPNPIVAGQILTYTIIVTNNGPSDATNASVVNQLPAGVSNVSVLPTQGVASYDPTTNTVTANFGTVRNGARATLQIFVTPTAGGTISNQTDVSSDSTNLVPANASVTTSVVVSPASDLAVTTSASQSPAPIGQESSIVVTITNNGPSDATGVTLTNVLPLAGLTIPSDPTPSQGSLLSKTVTATTVTYVYSIGTIVAQGTASLTILLTPNTLGSIVNTASVTTTAADTVPGNNTSTFTLPINPAANIGLTATPIPSSVVRGSTVTYSITLTNSGPSQADNVQLTDDLPAGAAFVTATTTQGTVAAPVGSKLVVSIGSIVPGQSVTVNISVIPTVAGTYTNMATVSTSTINTNPTTSISQTTSVSGLAGSVQFAASTYSVGENGGSIAITVNRVGGSAGQVSVDYATGGGTAIPKVNYTSVNGTLIFQDGETSKTIIVPVLDDQTPDSGTTFGIQLSNPGLGASLGSITSATVKINDTNGDLIPGPKIISVQRAGTGGTLQFVLTFNADMNPTAAQNLANYALTTLGRPPRRGAAAPTVKVQIKSALYDAPTRTVTLTVAGRPNTLAAYTLTVIGTAPTGVTNTAGVLLDGASTGRNGTNFVTVQAAIDPNFARLWQQYLRSRLPHLTTPRPSRFSVSRR